MKKSKINLISFISVLMLLLLILISFNFVNFADNYSRAETTQTNENFYVSVYDREDSELISDIETTFNGSKAYIFQWEDTKSLILNLDPAKRIPTVSYENGVEVYKLTIEIEYLQGYYRNVAWTNYNSVLFYSNTQRGTNSYQNFSKIKPEFDIDKGYVGTDLASGVQVNVATWGIYRFRMVINGQDTYSDYFVIEPTLDIYVAPQITYKTTPSQVTLHSAYSFSLKNGNEFKYIDKSKLIWYVLGKAADGTSYSLTFSDINSGKEDFKNCSSALYETWSRTGQTFYFDDNGVTGEWKVWCEYDYDGILKSNVQTIKTGEKVQFSTVIWIVLGVAGLCVIVTIIICVVKNKKEKVY